PRPSERVKVVRQRLAEADLDASTDWLLGLGDFDDAGRAIEFWAQGDAAIARDDGQRSGRDQYRTGNHAETVAELTALRFAQKLGRSQQPGDREQLGNVFRLAVQAGAVILDKVEVRITVNDAVTNAAASIKRIVRQLLEDEPPQLSDGYTRLLLQAFDGSE